MTKSWEHKNGSDWLIRGWFIFTALIAGVCLYRLAVIGETSLHSVFLGYSASRLLMMAAALLWCVIGIYGFIDPGRRVTRFVSDLSRKPICKNILIVLALVLSLGWIVGGFLSEEGFHPFFLRIEPLLILGTVISGSGALLLSRLSVKNNTLGTEQSAVRKTALLYFLIGCALYLFIRLTGVGIVPDEMDWQPTGMAIQYWEIYLSAWIALAASLLIRLLHTSKHQRLVTCVLFFVIWAAAAVLWVSIPTMEVLNHSYFMEITAPNYLPYPASDCANFGLWAESVLAGLGFKTVIAYRQFLIVVIACFEALTNRDLLKTIDCLTVTLALIPACMYLLGRRLHSHGAGILAAGMAALREYNTILLAPHYMVSNSKMWLSDLPAMLCLLATVCAAVDWFQKPRSVWRMLLSGCLMGLCVTVRSQFIALIPFIPVFFLLRNGLPFRKRLLPAVGFLLAALMVIAPWFIRSKILTGDFILDEPGVHSTELARRWSDDVNNVVSRNPGESDAEYAARNKQHMIDFFFEKPLYVIQFTASHFFANEIYGLTALPFGTDPGLTIHDVTNTDFHDVEGRLLAGKNVPVVLAFLAVISLGMGAAWKRAGWAGLLPMFMCSLYLGITSAARYSGWRFALPGDWFFYFYFALGLGEAAWQIAAALGGIRAELLSVPKINTETQPVYPAAVAGILVLFLLLGAAPALCGKILPQQVFMQTTEQNTRDLEAITAAFPSEKQTLDAFIAEPGTEVLNGRLIYPRYFEKNEGLSSGHPWIAYRIREFTRLGFVLLNEENHDVILPLQTEPSFIPNAAEVYVIGRDVEDHFRAEAVIIPNTASDAAPRILTFENQEVHP